MLVLAPTVVIVASVVLLPWLLVVRPRRTRLAIQRNALARQISDFHAQRWERPVLRGEAIEGNAFEAQEAAARAFGASPVDDFDAELDRVLAGGAPAPALFRDLERLHDDLEEEALRDALTGEPIEAREVEGGLELRSAGEDGVASDDDFSVTVPLP